MEYIAHDFSRPETLEASESYVYNTFLHLSKPSLSIASRYYAIAKSQKLSDKEQLGFYIFGKFICEFERLYDPTLPWN